jgi:hypothetical protein
MEEMEEEYKYVEFIASGATRVVSELSLNASLNSMIYWQNCGGGV